MKSRILMILAILTACMLTGCEKSKDQPLVEQIQQPITEPEQQMHVEESSEQEFSFADVADREFYFSSGAGGWYTVLYIHEDGSFDGHFQDVDMGVNGVENPNGTMYYSEFQGTFTEPEKVDDTTYVFQIASIEYPLGFGDEIKDGYHYCYSDGYGIAGAEDLYLYLPGKKLADLPEAYRSWVGYYDPESVSETELPFYGLYNETEENGFSSYVIESPDKVIEKEIQGAEEKAAKLQENLQSVQTQMELNEVSGEIYAVWDETLNVVWRVLKNNLDEDAMNKLTEEERTWIAEKETAVQEAGAEYEGGSMQVMVENQKAAQLTRERVYVLAEYFS